MSRMRYKYNVVCMCVFLSIAMCIVSMDVGWCDHTSDVGMCVYIKSNVNLKRHVVFAFAIRQMNAYVGAKRVHMRGNILVFHIIFVLCS